MSEGDTSSGVPVRALSSDGEKAGSIVAVRWDINGARDLRTNSEHAIGPQPFSGRGRRPLAQGRPPEKRCPTR